MIAKLGFACLQNLIITVHLHVAVWNASKLTLELLVHEFLVSLVERDIGSGNCDGSNLLYSLFITSRFERHFHYPVDICSSIATHTVCYVSLSIVKYNNAW